MSEVAFRVHVQHPPTRTKTNGLQLAVSRHLKFREASRRQQDRAADSEASISQIIASGCDLERRGIFTIEFSHLGGCK